MKRIKQGMEGKEKEMTEFQRFAENTTGEGETFTEEFRFEDGSTCTQTFRTSEERTQARFFWFEGRCRGAW